MATLSLIKYSNKVWKLLASDVPTGSNGFSYSKLQADSDGLDFFIVSKGGATTNRYQLSNITVFASPSGVAETGWASMQALLLRLEELNFPAWNEKGGGGGATTFLQLTDTPASYSGQGGKVVAVKSDATGLEFIGAPSGATPTLQEVTDEGNTTTNDIIVQPVNPEEGYLIQLKKEEGIVVSFENKSTQQTTAGFNIMNLSPSGGTLYGDESIYVVRGGTGQKLVHPIPTGTSGQILIPDVGNNTETMATREWVSEYIPSAIVESVTGDGVDNTDAANPVLTFPTPSEIGAAALAIQVTPVTLTVAGWTLVSGLYEYDYSNTNIASTSIVDVIPSNSTIAIVQNASILPSTISSTGSVKLFANNLPTGDIIVTFNIFN